jgi:hypothetical protein
VAIAGATGLTYTVLAGDAGKALTVTITATDSASTPAQATATTSPFNIPGGAALSIVSAGTISGTATTGATLNYATGSATGGTAPINYSWVWKKASDNSVLQLGSSPTYTIPLTLVGDRVYVELKATDSTGAFVVGDTNDYPAFPATITAAPFPGLSLTPSSGPNASPASVNTATLKGTATGSWPATPSPAGLMVTGDIQIFINGVGPSGAGGPYTINATDTLDIIWDPAVVSTAVDGATLTGSIDDGTYRNSFSMVVDRSPDSLTNAFTDLNPEPTSTVKTSNIVTPTGFNVPLTLTVAGTVSNPLTSFGAAVGVGAFGSAAQTVNPGDTIQLQGTTGGTAATAYGMTVNLGGATGTPATDTWTVTTAGGAGATVAQPTIATPLNNSTGVGTAAGITITASPYLNSGGAGTHASSDWELASDAAFTTIVASVTGSTTDLESWTLTRPTVTPNTTYYVRVRYTSNATVVTSAWSPGSKFTTGNMAATGTTWTTITTSQGALAAVAGNDLGQFVFGKSYGLGGNGELYTTNDFTSFTTTYTNSTGTFPQIYRLHYNGTTYSAGMWFNGGNTPVSATFSTDGVNWVNNPTTIPVTLSWVGPLYDVDYYNGQWSYAIQTNILGCTPDNGSTWADLYFTNAPVVGRLSNFYCMAHSPTAFVGFGKESGNFPQIVRTPDYVSWTNTAVTGSATSWIPNLVLYGNGIFLCIMMNQAAANATYVMRSTDDGVTWSNPAIIPGWAGYNFAGAYGNGLFVVTGGNGSIITSTDGVNWVSRPVAPSNRNLIDITYSAGKFVATDGSTGNIYVCED